MSMEEGVTLRSNPLRIDSHNVTDLVQSCVLPDGKTFHAFLCFSNGDRQFASKLFETLESLGLKICFHERDFIAGRSIFDNISTAIKDSFKTILILSPRFNTSQWCKSKMLIPLLYEEVDEMPDFLKTFSVINTRQDTDKWFKELLRALSASPKKLDRLKVPALPENYENHLLLVYHPDDGEFATKECSFLIEEDKNFICRHFPVDLEQVTSLGYIDSIVNLLRITLKVAILVSSSFEGEETCSYLCKLIQMVHTDMGKSNSSIIPLCVGVPVPPSLSDITCLTVASGDEGWKKRLLTASCLTPKNDGALTRISEFIPANVGDGYLCRILAVSVINGKIVVSDGNHESIKLYTITGQLLDCMFFETHAECFTRISSNILGVVLVRPCDLAVVKISDKFHLLYRIPCYGTTIWAAVATHRDTFIISTSYVPSTLYEVDPRGEVLREVVSASVTQSASKRIRYMDCNDQYIVAVDDQRRQIAVYTIDGELIMNTNPFMQETYVVRGVKLKEDVVYVVADNAVKIFHIRKDKMVVRRLQMQECIKDFQKTTFTRCIDLDPTNSFMLLSQANEESEFIRVLKIK